MKAGNEQSDILIVDDTPANLQVLANMLKGDGHKVRPVTSGEIALRAALNQPPDLVLLDINMPDMNGYEVCEKFREHSLLAGIPVIFISALSDAHDKLRAFRVGGVDYVTKPFQIEEVRARVHTHLRLRKLQLALEDHNRELERANNKLRELEEMRDNLTHMIIHDMRSPLAGIVTSLQFLVTETGESLSELSREDVMTALRSGKRLNDMVTELLDISRLETGEMPLALTTAKVTLLLEAAISSLGGLTRECSLAINCPPDVALTCDEAVVGRVLINLIANAIKFSPASTTIAINVRAEGPLVRFRVIDKGPGIPQEYRKKIFEKFGQAEARKNRTAPSAGLGLAFCKLAVEAHGGCIGVDSEVGQGSTFWFELPIVGPSS